MKKAKTPPLDLESELVRLVRAAKAELEQARSHTNSLVYWGTARRELEQLLSTLREIRGGDA